MKELSTKPYMLRAIHEWCSDSGLTPYMVVKVDSNTKVPREYVKNGEIVLNLSADATHKLTMGNDVVQFSARFGGVSREISIPVETIAGIFAKETGQGLFFDIQAAPAAEEPAARADVTALPEVAPEPTPPDTDGSTPQNGGRRRLQVVK